MSKCIVCMKNKKIIGFETCDDEKCKNYFKKWKKVANIGRRIEGKEIYK